MRAVFTFEHVILTLLTANGGFTIPRQISMYETGNEYNYTL